MKKFIPTLILILLASCQKTEKHPVAELTPEKVQQQITALETKRILFTLAADSMKGRDSKSGGYFKAQQCVIRNGGGSSKYQGLWLASTLSRFDNEKLRSPPLRIHSTLAQHLGIKKPLQCCKGFEEGGDILSHQWQYHLR